MEKKDATKREQERKKEQAALEKPARLFMNKVYDEAPGHIYEKLLKYENEAEFKNFLIGHIMYDLFPRLNAEGWSKIFSDKLRFGPFDNDANLKSPISITVLAEGKSEWTSLRRADIRNKRLMGSIALAIVNSIRIREEWKNRKNG